MAGGGRGNADSKLLTVLATGATIAQAAIDVGVSENTIRRRLKEPGFRAELDEIKDEILSNTVTKLADACSRAVETLKTLLDCDSPTTRLGAARSILELSVSMRANVDFAERITRLEEKHGKPKQATR